MIRTLYHLLIVASISAPFSLFSQTTTTNLNIDAENYTNTFRSMHIDVEQRGCDYADAFYHLLEAYPDGSIYAVVKGISIDYITEMAIMPQKSLMMIQYGKHGVPDTKIVHVDDIEEMGIRKVSRSPISVFFPQSTEYECHDHHHIHDVDDTPNYSLNPNVHYHQIDPHGEYYYEDEGCYGEDCEEYQHQEHHHDGRDYNHGHCKDCKKGIQP